MDDIEMTVVETSSLPEKFQPTEVEDAHALQLSDLLADLVEEATSELTDAERRAFLSRLQDERPEIFQEPGVPGGEVSSGAEDLTREEWKKHLATWLKEEANRFMAAAARL